MKWIRLTIISFLVLLVYYSIIMTLQTRPVSDFEVYYKVGLVIKGGDKVWDTYKYFQGLGYPWYLAVVFKIFNTSSIILPQIFNGLLLLSLSLFSMNYAFIENRYLKWVGFFVMAFNLNYLSMISTLCSEIPYGFIFMGGLLLIWVGFKILLSDTPRRITGATFILIIVGTLLGLSQSMRPMTTPFIILFSLVFSIGIYYFGIHNLRLSLAKKTITIVRFLLPIWASFFVTATSIYYVFNYGLTFHPLQNGLWNT